MTHKYVFDYHDGDVYWCTADVGWVTGHSYIVYGPLANGATTLMFEGVPNYPDASRFWQVIDKHQVNIFYTAPTAIRALMREGDAPVRQTSRSSLRRASGWCATAGWLWTNCGVPRPGSARACGVPAWSMAWPSPSTCRPATKACCWWPAIRRRALRWTGSACSSHRCSPPPVASPALRRSSRPTRSRRCCSTARRRRWNSNLTN